MNIAWIVKFNKLTLTGALYIYTFNDDIANVAYNIAVDLIC